MRLKKQEREFFRKLLENFFVKNPHFKRCQVVDQFVQEGTARQTIYNALYRCKNGQSILCDTHLGPPSSWTSSIKVKLERLINNQKMGSQPKLN
jgi:hypothetical protein